MIFMVHYIKVKFISAKKEIYRKNVNNKEENERRLLALWELQCKGLNTGQCKEGFPLELYYRMMTWFIIDYGEYL